MARTVTAPQTAVAPSSHAFAATEPAPRCAAESHTNTSDRRPVAARQEGTALGEQAHSRYSPQGSRSSARLPCRPTRSCVGDSADGAGPTAAAWSATLGHDGRGGVRRCASPGGAVCQELPGINAAYIVRVRQTSGNNLPASEALQVGYELNVPPSSVEDARATRDIGPALLAALPPALSSMGVCKLSTAAVPAWRRRGVQAFARNS